jgi:glucokinase
MVLNDYQALARSLPELDRADLTLLGGQPGQRLVSPVAVLGPGTGLGVGGALPTPWGWAVVSGEGGHVTLAPADDEEAQVLARLRGEIGHVSAEALLCGSGLERLHNLLHGERCAAAQISAAVQRHDSAAAQTFDLFFRFLGITAGNLALTLGARGGIYLAGGILAKLGAERIKSSRLHSRLIAKGRFTEYLRPVPVQLVDDPDRAALVGVRAWLDDLLAGQRGRDSGDRRRG